MRRRLRIGGTSGVTLLLSCILSVACCITVLLMPVQAVVNTTSSQTPTVPLNDTPTPTPSHTPTSTPCPTPTASSTPFIVCTPPACGTDEQLHCPTYCPGGCGYICITNTPRMHTPVPRMPLEVIAPDNVHLLKPLVVIYPNARLTDLAFRGNTEIVTVGYTDNRISRWDLHSGYEIGQLGADSGGALAISVAVSPDRSLVATGGGAWDRRVRLWDVRSGAMRDLGYHDDIIRGLAFSPNGKLLASGDGADDVQIWDVKSGQPVIGFRGDVSQYGQGFANLHWLDGETIAAAGNHAIYWWDVTTGVLRERLPIPTGAPFFVDVAFGQNTDRLAAAAQDDVVYFWDRASGAWATWPVAPAVRLNEVAFSPDAQVLATGSFEDGLFLWDVAQQELLARRAYPADDVVDLEFSPDGRFLAAIGWDMTVWLWGIPSDTPPAVPEGSTLILLGIGAAGLAGYVALYLRAQRRTGTM